ncbi:hypothetical protein OSB04_003870 [Centaurea solstitialis]|uniref:Bidirectional sugar transporter SWEET n=1 Tax=Centaurea solstitialis TaxID=347529 RepID=A0AA38WVE1_9ASTR|nr:hypothetical protein OSB04_003870 [Centaurea solstitialis]
MKLIIFSLHAGNVISFMVFLAPASMIWIYYASLKTDATLLITINAVGCVIETLYIAIYIAYAPKNVKIQTTKLVLSLNFVGFWVITLSTHYLAKVQLESRFLRKVIQTKSVEFMPIGLSFFLVLSSIMWFLYGLFQKDIYIALPNIIGFILSVLQMVLYMVYKNHNKKTIDLEKSLPTSIPSLETHPVCKAPKQDAKGETKIKDHTMTLKCTNEEDIESRVDESLVVCTTQSINDLIKDVMKEDSGLETSRGCTSMMQPIVSFDHCNQKKIMESPNQVYLIESAV